jgi:hypothetical protein
VRALSSAILAVLLLAAVAAGFQQSPDAAGPVATATILNSRYCLGTPSPNVPMVRRNGRLEPIELFPPDAITLRLQLSVGYRNTGTVPWILPVASQAVVLAGTDPAALAEVPQPILTQGPAPSEKLPDGSEEMPSRSLFPAIPPGESLSVTNPLETVLLHIFRPSIKSEPDLRGKKIYVRLEFFSSRWTPRLLSRLAKKWKNYGTLWTESVRTEPIEINVPRTPEIADCLR